MLSVGITHETQAEIFKLLSAILHLDKVRKSRKYLIFNFNLLIVNRQTVHCFGVYPPSSVDEQTTSLVACKLKLIDRRKVTT